MFHSGPARERELVHDAQLYRAYLRASERQVEHGAHIERVMLEQDLRRQYPVFLQEPNRGRADSDGRPGRDRDDVSTMSRGRGSAFRRRTGPVSRLQIESLWPDGRRDIQNVEVLPGRPPGAPACGDGGWRRLHAISRHLRARWRQDGAREPLRSWIGRGRTNRPDRRERQAPMSHAERVAQIRGRFGLTERQAGFLVTVMLHAGVCVARQDSVFARIKYGEPMRTFFQTLQARRFATPETGAHGLARLFHVRYEPSTPPLVNPTTGFAGR